MWVRDREETPLAYNVSQLLAREVKTFLHFYEDEDVFLLSRIITVRLRG